MRDEFWKEILEKKSGSEQKNKQAVKQ